LKDGMMKKAFAQHGLKRVLFIGKDEVVDQVKRRTPHDISLAYYNLDGSFGVLENGRDRKFRIDDEQPLADKIVEVITRTEPREVLLYHPLTYNDLVEVILNSGERVPDLRIAPEVYRRYHAQVKQRANGCLLPGIKLDAPNLQRWHAGLKRAMDIVLSLFFMVLFSPLFIIVPILIKLTSRGSVFHIQTRCGHNGKPFRLYKFRSMIPEAEELLPELVDFDKIIEPVFKIENDRRVTRIGRIVRRTSIDELPQLFNVLRGDLSLVGPRPEELALVRRYNGFFRERLKARPGITGLQQIHCRGSLSMLERMKYDLAYIKNQSLWLDLKILLKTVKVVLSQEGAR
jgi:exopolysaccharide biosynthesis polyprenyl glycosylphosphotransferase